MLAFFILTDELEGRSSRYVECMVGEELEFSILPGVTEN